MSKSALSRAWPKRRSGALAHVLASDRRRKKHQNKCTACGAKNPIAVNANPATPRAIANQVNTIIPVMTVADASTMPIWNAADATS